MYTIQHIYYTVYESNLVEGGSRMSQVYLHTGILHHCTFIDVFTDQTITTISFGAVTLVEANGVSANRVR